MDTPSSRLYAALTTITDFRMEKKVKHKLVDILAIGICAVIANADEWVDMEEFGKEQHEWFKTWLELPSGIPSHDTFRRVFTLLPPESLHHCFEHWIQTLIATRKPKHIAIDGKTVRGSANKRNSAKAIHVVSAYATDYGLVLSQLKNDDKSNEITAIPELLEHIDINDAVVTIDAMGCQKSIATQIVKRGGTYVLAVKNNQRKLFNGIEKYFFDGLHCSFSDLPYEHLRTVDGDHGRVETRDYHILHDGSFLDSLGTWGGIHSIGWVRRHSQENGVVSIEDRYYIISGKLSIECFSECVRGHWGIENRLHWILDVSFREDDCRVRSGYGAENLSLLRRFALNLLREEKSCNRGIAGKRKKAAWNVNYLAKVMGFKQ